MPLITTAIEPDGLFVRCRIGPSRRRALELAKVSRPVSGPIDLRAILDTGASCTCVDSALIARLGLTPTGAVELHTPSTGGTPHRCEQYDVSLSVLFEKETHTFAAVPVVACDFSGQGIDALIGRDLLGSFHLMVNGPYNFFTLSI